VAASGAGAAPFGRGLETRCPARAVTTRDNCVRLSARAIGDCVSKDVELQCRCGQVHGWLRDVSPSRVNRPLCYCDDCQAFLHYLGRADLLDEHGGTDVVQVAPSSVTFDHGEECIVAVRLTSKGMHRWYATCCKTPLGNTLTPAVPFIGMPLEVLRGAPTASDRDQTFGKVRAAIMGKFAVGGPPKGSTGFPIGMIAHVARLLLGWKLGGRAWPHPFFRKGTAAPIYPVTILEAGEREALRAKCGPNPTER